MGDAGPAVERLGVADMADMAVSNELIGALMAPEDNASPGTPTSARQAYIRSKMEKAALDYSDPVGLRILCGTFNVNGRKPIAADGETPIDLTSWIRAGAGAGAGPPDVVAVGFQELDLAASNFLLNNSDFSGLWRPVIESALGRLGEYTLVASKQLVGMLLLVSSQKEVRRTPHPAPQNCPRKFPEMPGMLSTNPDISGHA